MADVPQLQGSTTPLAMADRQRAIDNLSLKAVRALMNRDPTGRGISALGYDGVLRTFDEERNVVDAVGLNPVQIREYYAGLPLHPRFLTADGRDKSQWDMFHPAAENVPKKFTEEEKANILAQNAELVRRGITCCNRDK